MARKSDTLVRVGPVTSASPSAAKNGPLSWLASDRAASRPSALARIRVCRIDVGAGRGGRAIDAIAVGGKCVDGFGAIQRQGEREGVFAVRTSASPSVVTHGQFAAGEDHGGLTSPLSWSARPA